MTIVTKLNGAIDHIYCDADHCNSIWHEEEDTRILLNFKDVGVKFHFCSPECLAKWMEAYSKGE